MNRVALWIIPLLAVASSGCGAKSSSDPRSRSTTDDEPAAYSGTMLTTSDGAKFVGDSIAIDVRKGPTEVQVDLQVLAYGQNELWTGIVRLPPSHVPMGAGTADIRQAPLQAGVAAVERQRKGKATISGDNGTIAYELDGKRAKMRIQSSISAISGMLDATYAFRCWVPPGELGLSPTGQSPEGAVEVVLDESFRSGFCAQFRR